MSKPNNSSIFLMIVLLMYCCFASVMVTPVFASPNTSSTQSTDFFVSNWKQAIQMVEAMDRPLFVYLYVDYERESNLMNSEVFTNPSVKQLHVADFVSLKISLHSPDGPKLRQKYQLREFPAFLYFDQKGNLLKKETGFKRADELLSLSRSALRMNPYKRQKGVISPFYVAYIEKKMQYENGVRQIDFLYDLAYDRKKFNDDYLSIVGEYIDREGINNLTKDRHLNFIFDFADDVEGLPFEIVMNNKQRYIDFFGREKVDKLIKRAIRSAVIIAARYQNWSAFEEIKHIVDKADIMNQKDFEFLMLTVYYENTQNWGKFTQIIEDYTRVNPSIEASILNDLAWRYAINIKDKAKLQDALSWSERAVQLKPQVFKYQETYAAVLYLLGKKAKALKEAETAKIIARKYGEDYRTTLKLSQAIRSNDKLPIDLN